MLLCLYGQRPGWYTNYGRGRGHIFQNDRSGSHHGVFSNPHSLNHHGARPNMSPPSHLYSAAQHYSRSKMRVLSNDAIMIHTRTCVDDAILLDNAPRLKNGSRHDLSSVL